MRVDWKTEICGEQPIKLRDMLRRIGKGYFSWHYVAEYCVAPPARARKIIAALVSRGWLEFVKKPIFGICYGPHGAKFFQLTMRGNAFTSATAMRRIPRTRAEKYLQGFVERVKILNGDDQYGFYVTEAHVFGSYLDPAAADLGDVDIALAIARRPIIDRDLIKHSLQRAEDAGCGHWSYFDRAGYSELEVRRFLRARNGYISLSSINDLEATGAKSKLLYRASKRERKMRPAIDTCATQARPARR